MFTHHRQVRKVLGLVLGAALTLSIAACGSSDEDSGSESGTAKVRVANYGLLPSSATLAWAIEGGYFEKHDVEVELNPPLLNAADMMNSVMTDKADVAMTNPTAVAAARNVKRPAVLVATLVTGYAQEIAFQPSVDKKLREQGLSEDSPMADRVKALKGLTLGTNPPGSSGDAVLRFLLEEHGLDPDKDVTLRPISDIAGQVAALRAEQVDGIVSILGASTTLAGSNGSGVVWDYMTGSDALESFPLTGIATSEAFAKNNSEALQRFLDALYEARAALVAGLSPEDAEKLKEIVAPDMDQALYDTTMEGTNKQLTAPFTTSDAAWETTIAVGNITSDTPLEVPASEAIDNSFAEKVK